MNGLSQLLGLPLWIKGVLGMSTLGLLTLGAAMLGGPTGIAIVAGGIVLIAALLYVYRRVLRVADKRKSSPFMQKLRENSAATPQGVSDPSHRAQLDDMRKKFEHGMEIFKEHGKDLYSMPWYLLVGEPGSGKTEMVRRCNVGFPPGLQDTLQGTGGTVNMHWWFTNHAVILDTAGKLMFEDAPAGQTTVWKEFLKQLRVGRPNCPVNGMLLVIPADTLIVDSSDEIQRKAGKIAEQLDAIQRALGVRFPVFVVISKCDKVNGFKEFFDSIRDPQLQHQMLGWSNPDDLDTAFNPEHVDQHLATVQQRLRRRRLGLLIDPVHTEDPNGRRIDQVDAMYALPDSIMQVAPRLRRYLETIFVAGEWSSKPLFLRGIYFNSALREGDALDADLAAMFSVPVDALPEGKVWERERSYFIRDLLMNKVFKEKGLVTRASNARQLQRQRLGIVMGAAIAAVMISIGLLVFSGTRFKRSVGQHVDFWQVASRAVVNGEEIAPAVRRLDGDSYELSFRNADELAPLLGLGSNATVPYSRVVAAIAERSATRISVPFEFRWIRMFGGSDPARKQAEAAQTVVDNAVLRPLIDGTRRKFENSTFRWSESAWSDAALAELVRVERDAFRVLAPRNEAIIVQPPEIEPLVRFLNPDVNPDANEDRVEATERDVTYLQSAVRSVYIGNGEEQTPSGVWPSERAGAAPGTGLASVTRGLELMRTHWTDASSGTTGTGLAAKLAMLERASLALNEAEVGPAGLLLGVGFENATRYEDHAKARDQWKSRLLTFSVASTSLSQAIEALGDQAGSEPRAWVQAAEQELLQAAESGYKRVLDQMPDLKKALGPDGKPLPSLNEDANRLVELGSSVETTRDDLRRSTGDRLKRMEESLKKAHDESLRASVVAGASGRLFEVRQRIYETLDQQLFAADPRESIAQLKPSLDEVAASALRAEQQVSQYAAAGPGLDVFQRAVRVSSVVLEASKQRRHHDLIASLLDGFERAEMARLVSEIAAGLTGDERDITTPAVPLNALGEQRIDDRYHPIAARAAFSAWNDANGMLSPPTTPGVVTRVLDADSLRQRQQILSARVGSYVGDYATYWQDKVLRPGTDVRAFSTWAEFRQEVLNLQATDVNESLDELLEMVGEALTGLPSSSASVDELIQVAVDQVRTERGFLSGARQREPFRTKATETLKGLFDLGARAADARRSILSMTPREFRTRVLAVYSREDQSGVTYWNQLVVRGLAVVVEETAGELESSVRRLLADGNRVPLSRGATGTPMSMREFQELLVSIESLASSSTGTASTGGRTIGEGESMEDSRLDQLLDRMSGQRVLTGRERQEWFASLRQVAGSLGSAQGPLAYTITILDSSEQAKVGYRGAFPYVRVKTAERTDGPYWLSDPKEMATMIRVEEGSTLTLEFAQGPEGPWGGAVVQTPSGWTLAALAVSTGTRDSADPLLWKVPINVGGDRCLLGVRFNRQLPSHEAWPTPGTWPR